MHGVGYPHPDEESEIYRFATSVETPRLSALMKAEDIFRIQQIVDRMVVSDYVMPITARVREGIATWLETGRVDAPEGLAGLEGESAGGEQAGGEQTESTVSRKIDEALQRTPDPLLMLIRRQLGQGRSLDTSVRSRLESGFGRSLGDVRVHADSGAARLARQQAARAFTVGREVVFGSGEYQPGTPVGDALLAPQES